MIAALFCAKPAQSADSLCQALFQPNSLASDPFGAISRLKPGPGFVVPNEENTDSLRRFFSAPGAIRAKGLFVSVGTERAFMTAALAGEKVETLVLVDIDPRILFFNRINKALLAISRSREDYLKLRLEASFEDVLARTRENGQTISNENRVAIEDSANWSWWTVNVQRAGGWSEFHQADSSLYRGTNYLFDNALFDSVSKLAKENRIVVIEADLGSTEFRQRLGDISVGLNQKIAFFDISNAWAYLGHQRTVEMFASLNDLTTAQTNLILTYQTLDPHQKTIFQYAFVQVGDSKAIDQELHSLMGMMARLDPSRRRSPDDRMRSPRFDRGRF